MSALDISRFRHEVCRIARANLGYGEHNPNFLNAIGARADHEWCAIFAAYCNSKAAASLKLEPATWCYRRRNVLEPGAKRLVRNLGKVGRIWKRSELDLRTGVNIPRHGDLVCWKRGILGWQGHVGIVLHAADGWFESIEGNVGGKVVLRQHKYTEPRLWRFASVEGGR